MELVLIRDHFTANETLGVLKLAELRFQTIERPWIPDPDPGEDGGMPHVSCIPEGTYALVPHSSVKHPRVFALVNDALDVVHNPTPGKRSDILIHAANWARELEGCIAPGRERVRDGNGWMVTHSAESMRAIMAALSWELGHTIIIRRAVVESNV